MASSGKKKTTMAKLQRETRLRERKRDKQARKDARRHSALNPDGQPAAVTTAGEQPLDIDEGPSVDGELSASEGGPAPR